MTSKEKGIPSGVKGETQKAPFPQQKEWPLGPLVMAATLGSSQWPRYRHGMKTLSMPNGHPRVCRGYLCCDTEGAETHRALHRAHRVRQRMQRFSAMYTLSEGRQGRGENTLKWETFVHASSPLPPT